MYGYIYKTTNLINNKIYIGKKKGEFTNKYLGSGKRIKLAIDKYGVENFVVQVLCYCDTLQQQNELERYWISYYSKIVELYNISQGGDGGNIYFNVNEKTRQERITKLKKNSYFLTRTSEQKAEDIRKAAISRRKSGGYNFSAEQRHRMSESHKGKKLSVESIQKIKEARKRQKITEETRRKISESNKGKKLSNETRQRISQRLKGTKTGPLNPFYGKHHTEEVKAILREKTGKNNLGKKFSQETRQRMSQSMKGIHTGKIFIHNDYELRCVKKEVAEQLLQQGYRLGRKDKL